MRTLSILTFFALVFSSSEAFAQVGNTTLINPNLATADELAALPGMNASLVQAVIDARPLADNLALNAAIGSALNAEQKTALYSELFLAINLNNFTNEELQLMPGMTNRWVREFNEYAPYENLEEFRREMAKYTDAAGVAALEKFVFVPLDLNSASDEDFMTIPGMTARWLREFNEYKPYENMDEFNSEMGKYADALVVSQLARYVYVAE